MLILVLVLKDSLRTFFKSLSLSWSLGVRSLSWSLGVRSLSLSWSLGVRSLSLSLGGQAQEVLVLVLVLGGQVLVLVLGGQVLVNIPANYPNVHILIGTPTSEPRFPSPIVSIWNLGNSPIMDQVVPHLTLFHCQCCWSHIESANPHLWCSSRFCSRPTSVHSLHRPTQQTNFLILCRSSPLLSRHTILHIFLPSHPPT